MSTPRFNNKGEIAFIGEFANPSGQFEGTGIWTNTGGSLSLLIGDLKLDNTDIDYIGQNDGFSFNDPGHVAFYATAQLSTGFVEHRIWSYKNGRLSVVEEQGSGIWGTRGKVHNLNKDDPAFNQAGNIAFSTSLLGVDSAIDSGIWSNGLPVAIENEPAPGASPSRFSDLSYAGRHLLLNGNETAVFSAGVYHLGGILRAGIWKTSDAGLVPIAVGTTPAPGTDKLFYKSLFQQFAVNNNDQVAFLADLVDPSNLNQPIGEGIWIEGASGLELIAATGTELLVGPGDLRTVESLRFAGGTRNEEGRGISGFNDLGELVFAATFTDGSQGVFYYGAPIPEPSTLCLLIISMASLVRLRFRLS